MRKYYNDFFTVTAPPSQFIPGQNANFVVSIDVNNFNSIIIVNQSNRIVRVPFADGLNLGINDKIEIIGNKDELNDGNLSVMFLKSLLFGKLLVIRKKYI
jgi:hypothetical protein